MYLVSLYFDKKTEKQIQSYIDDVANKCGNSFMVDKHVSPHITVSAFETLDEKSVVEAISDAMLVIKQNKIEWVTVGTFPTVIFIQPVLNEYLHHLSVNIYEAIKNVPEVKISRYYKPFSWLPHATIAKQLTEDEIRKAFDLLQKSFGAFEGEVVRIELAKKNPYRVIASWDIR